MNEYPVSGKKMKKLSGFVFQDDVLFDTMTVRESLMMSATLRLPRSVSEQEKIKKVSDIIKILGLEKAQNTKIGTPEKKGISGGERKRTAIAMEMITDPQILFLDEPTSGLDTFTAFNVMSKLKDVAQSGRTIVATIHQPSSKTFMLFDDLLLLAEGKVVYHGPVSEVLDYFGGMGYVCPAYMNPADFLFMEVLNSDADSEGTKSADSTSSIEVNVVDRATTPVASKSNALLISSWEQHQREQKDPGSLDAPSDASSSSIQDPIKVFQSQKTNSTFGTQFKFLAGRVGRNMIRNKMIIFARLGRSLFSGILMASIYYGVQKKVGFAETQDRVFALFFIITNEFFNGIGNSVFLFSAERGVFLREYHNGYYTLLPYFLSKTLMELPAGLISPIISASIMYPLVGLRSGIVHFLTLLITVQALALVSASMGLMLGAMFPNFEMAMSLMPAITLPMMIFSGVQINLKTIPIYFRFMPYISPLRYAFSAMAQNEFRGLKFNMCDPSMGCSGDQTLKQFALEDDPSIWVNWLILVLMYLVYTFGGLACLWRATKK